MDSFIQPFKYLRDVDNDHKIGETLRKLVTHNLLKLGQEEVGFHGSKSETMCGSS